MNIFRTGLLILAVVLLSLAAMCYVSIQMEWDFHNIVFNAVGDIERFVAGVMGVIWSGGCGEADATRICRPF